MILSKQHNIIVLSPPKTGTRYRMIRFKDVNDMRLRPGNMHCQIKDLDLICSDNDLDKQKLHKVACVRNPWRRYASLFHMIRYKNAHINNPKQDFLKWINSEHFNRRAFSLDRFLFDDDGSLAVDEVIPVDEWNKHIDKLKLLLGDNSELIHDYQTSYSYENTYKQWYNQQAIDRVSEKDAKTIKLIGYKFE